MNPEDEARLIAEAKERQRAQSDRRSAEAGELCGCGRQAVTVYLGGHYGDVGDCLMGEAAGAPEVCPFCRGELEHERSACPWYRLTLDSEPHPRRYSEPRWIGGRRLDPAGPVTLSSR